MGLGEVDVAEDLLVEVVVDIQQVVVGRQVIQEQEVKEEVLTLLVVQVQVAVVEVEVEDIITPSLQETDLLHQVVV